MASALDTLCGQAYGARQYHLLGVYKQRAMVILTLVSIPLAVVWFYTGEILLLFGQDPDIAAEAGTYARWMIPAIFAYGLLQCHVRFLQTQNIVFPALSNAISYWVYVIVLAVYVRVSSSCKETWTGFSAEAFRDVLSFFRLAVPSALMVW
ncbi:unnamed protein product [Triticum turgidum subsp. durum]|uniref:Protein DETOXIFICATION n=1 Tax=Triticum turgidum subsp. durum TaxID=4567 RepID=A0A9R1BLV4_TRITD|nr:unnamed protein product [Triticum turgidum subsp. durum]